jgi:hypothetical protein
MTLLNPDLTPAAPEANAALTQALEAFSVPSLAGKASNVLKANAEAAAALEVPEPPTEEVPEPPTEEEPELEVEPEEEEQEQSLFAEEFQQEFGMSPEEARELVVGLQGFRQELTLMREWQVNPAEYDSRITQVKTFYESLPEGERDKFNSPEGAKAIWNHLVKQATKAPNRSRRASRGVQTQAPAPKQELIKRSDILAMDEATYQRSLPAITKAFREGRVVD